MNISYMAIPGLDVEKRDLLSYFFSISGVEETHFFSKKRISSLVNSRYSFFAMAKVSGMSLKKIGKMVNKDHATVVHGLKLCNDALQNRAFNPYLHDLLVKIGLKDFKYEPKKSS